MQQGTTLRFVVDNGDPIGHELIVGPPRCTPATQSGTEAAHPPVPGEVTVTRPAPRRRPRTRSTSRARSTFACHLPGHVAYGMIGRSSSVE